MAKHSEAIQGTEKEFLDEFQKLCYSRSSWQVWADLMAAMACSISNVADRSPEHYESREKEYAQCIERLGSVEIPAKMLAIIVEALERNPEQDFLGEMYMQLNLGNHQKGNSRWIPDEGNIACMESILYPGNLPQAWEHTPMKYSALEILAQNIPTTAFRYEDALDVYLKFPKLEWFCKMGLNQLAKDVVRGYNYSGNMTGKVNYKADTIYEILGLNKVNTRTLQAIDGNHYELRLLQVAQRLDIQMKPEQLKEFYETFECNTDLLKEKNRRVSLHKLCRYIDKESERYPIGEKNACMWGYSYNRYKERTDPRIERKQNMAHDWLEYIGWCRELKYDLDNKFIYMPNNFKKVHDRTAEEYKALQDKKAAAEKKRREKLAAKKMAETKKAMEEIFSRNDGVDAFQIKGKGLILVVPQSGDEIRKEGEALHHCVGGYVDRVARGETNIFFIRKADHPEKSYFTMEWRNNKIIQCRGFKNCGMPADVQAFVKVFEKKMNEAIQGDNKKNAKRKAG